MDKKIDSRQIRREKMRRYLKIAAAVIAAGVVLGVTVSSLGKSVNRADLTIATVDNGPLETTVPATGRIVPEFEEIINSPVSTRLLRVYAQPGDTVKAGMPLLQLDLESEETAYNQLLDRRDIGRQELTQLQLTNRTLISDLEMQIEVNEMQVNRMRIEVDNERRLDSLGSGTGDRVRQAETAYAAGVLELKQLRQKLANERLRTAAAEEVQRLNVNTVSKDIALMERTLHRGQIPAPHDGILTFLTTEIGSQINAGEKVAVVSDLSTFKIQGEIAEGNSNKINIGSSVSVRIGKTELSGTVTNITPRAQAGIISFMVRLDDPGNDRLRSGQRVDMYVNYGYKDNVLRLPSGAFFKGSGPYRLFVLDGDSKLTRREVNIGDSNRDYVEVLSGLRAGDRVVISNTEQYQQKKSLHIK